MTDVGVLSELSAMRVLYCGGLSFGTTTEHRLRAFRRAISNDVIEFPYECYLEARFSHLWKIAERFMVSPGITAMNRGLLRVVAESRPEIVWLDKPLYFHPQTILELRRRGTKAIAYMPDDPYGPREDFGWQHFKKALPYYWGHVVSRQVTRADFLAHGASRVVCAPFAFEPSIHFPPQALRLATPKSYDVSFVGSPYDERAEWIIRLVRELPEIRFGLFGPGWRRFGERLRSVGLICLPPVWNDQYREVIWRSKLSLSFVTRSNRDESSHKAMEIAASGTAVLVESSPVHDRVFRDRETAFFFSDPRALSAVVRDALMQPERLRTVGLGGADAVRTAQLDNDHVLRSALADLEQCSPAGAPDAGASAVRP